MQALYLYIFCSSRDKTNLNDLINDDATKIILQNAGLTKIYEKEKISCIIGKNKEINNIYIYI